MIRATVWTVGLFGAGAAVTRVFPGTWTEPLVLLALGIALLFVSARTARSVPTVSPASRGTAGLPRAAPSVEPAPVRAATPIPAPATARVENTA